MEKVNKEIRFQNKIHHAALRDLYGTNTQLSSSNFMYPVFVTNNNVDEVQPIESMPGLARYGINALIKHLQPLVKNGLKSILIFGVVSSIEKTPSGSAADDSSSPVCQVLPILRREFPNLMLACDVCLCPYTVDGHCQIGSIELTNERLAEICKAYAKAGAHVVAPSDMTDNRIAEIKKLFLKENIRNVSILSYAAKFASNFYGPFRDAAQSAPTGGDRQGYQLPKTSTSLALQAVQRDIDEGADMIMVKPGMPYLDILQQVKTRHPDYPLYVYQVSGEYCMLYHAAKAGALDLEKALIETMIGFRRAGADCIITYFTPQLLDIIKTL